MNARFADSNTLLYFASDDARKAAVAEAMLREGLTISVQVLNEMANVFRRKWDRNWDATERFLEIIRGQTVVVPVTLDTHEIGLHVAQRYRLSIYDGMIVAAALLAQCDTLYSEDMQHGLVIEELVRIVNPFRSD
jgi:predicted nucleic acid-binding protein